MEQQIKSLKNSPGAWVPLAMSFVALVLLVGYIAFFGMQQSYVVDEGRTARLFQFLIIGQLPIMAFFVFKYLRKHPKETLQILAIQIFAALCTFGSVFILEL